MQWVDAHLDLGYLAVRGRDLRRPARVEDGGCVSLPALREGGVDLVMATIFVEPGQRNNEPWGYCDAGDTDGAERAAWKQIEVYRDLEAQGELSIVRRAADLDRDGPLPRLVLLMEGADPIRSPEVLREWRDAGVRAIGLTWSPGSRFAGGNSRPGPLTDAGRELVTAMDELGLIHDASHLADAALDELLAIARGPVVATHSNCRALVRPVQRHLTDEHIRAIGTRGGMIGLNLFSRFLVPEGRASIADCVRHIERIVENTGRRDAVGLGSDMDGGFPPAELPAALDHPARLDALAEALRERGWGENEVAGFAGENWRHALRQYLQGIDGRS